MFNSIRKDDSCRKLVKSFEILRLQNKIIVQAMSKPDVFSMQAEKKVEKDVTFFHNAHIKLKAFSTPVEEKKPSLLSSNSNLTLQNEKLSITKGNLALPLPSTSCKTEFCTKATIAKAGYGNKNSKPFAITVNNNQTNKVFYNYNCFTDLELCKSSLHLFAKKRVKAENINFSIFPNNKSSSSKIKASYKAFSPSLLSLAKGRIISLPRNSSKSRIKNRCIETGRSHSVLRFCKLSRIRLRDNASKALISGISKASW